MERSKRYGIYHMRWQVSAIVMMLPMYVATSVIGLSSWLSLIPVHFIGAIVFWYVDKNIFESD